MQEEMKLSKTEQKSKRHYEKPSVAPVRLFADQVLGCTPAQTELCGGDPEPNLS